MSEQDLPFDEAVASATRKIMTGFDVYQKFTCQGCGHRLTMAEPNCFYTTGTCDRCDAVTDIAARGCGYMAAISTDDNEPHTPAEGPQMRTGGRRW